MIVFIKTHGRPNAQHTFHALRDAGYKGKIVLVLDDEDDTYYEYLKYAGEGNTDIRMFNKEYYVQTVDSGVSNPKRKVNLYAWCACEDLVREYGVNSCVMADDDITGFRFRYKDGKHLRSLKITQNLDEIFALVEEYMLSCNLSAMSTGIPQMYFSGDIEKDLWKWRVPYTFIFRNTKHKLNWVSEYEEDIITAIRASIDGQYLSVLPVIQRETVEIGTNYGGMHNSYTDSFVNAQYGYIWYPSCREIIPYKDKFMCKIKRDNAFAKLVSSSYCIHK